MSVLQRGQVFCCGEVGREEVAAFEGFRVGERVEVGVGGGVVVFAELGEMSVLRCFWM